MNRDSAPGTAHAARSGAAALSCAAALLAGCASDAGLKPQAAPLDPASLSTGAPAAAGAAWPEDGWWRGFGDAQLERLLVEALAGSPGIAAAQARVRRAEELARAVGTAREPSLALVGSAERMRLTEHGMIPPLYAGATVTSLRAGIDLRFDFDFWDRNGAALRAALGEARAAAAEAAASRLALQHAVAGAYFALQRTLGELGLVRARTALLAALERLARERQARGIDSALATASAAQAHAQAAGALVAIEREAELLRNQIAALIGKGPQAGREILPAAVHLPSGLGLPANLPADLIGRRPDVAALRERAEAAAAAIDAARTQFYPNIDLLAFAGLQSIGLSRLIDAGSGTLSVGPALRLPLFNQTSLRAGLAAKNAEFDIAVNRYNESVVGAVREAADAAARLRAAGLALAEQQRALDAAQRSHELARSRQRSGLGSAIPALGAEIALLERREQRLRLREQQIGAALEMIRALGGGYGS